MAGLTGSGVVNIVPLNGNKASEPEFVNPGIDSPAWRAGATNLSDVPARQAT
jgi:hypothetical protein